jgi:hypothetical protein
MSIENLIKVRDEVIATGHGLYLECTQKLLKAIDEHVATPVAVETKVVKAKAAKVVDEVVNATGEAAGEAFESR